MARLWLKKWGIWLGVQSFLEYRREHRPAAHQRADLPLMSYGGSAVIVDAGEHDAAAAVWFENRLKIHGYEVKDKSWRLSAFY